MCVCGGVAVSGRLDAWPPVCVQLSVALRWYTHSCCATAVQMLYRMLYMLYMMLYMMLGMHAALTCSGEQA